MGRVEQLTKALELIIMYHPCAFDVLLGVTSPPSDQDWLEMKERARSSEDLGVRVDKDRNLDGFFDTVTFLDEIHRAIDPVGWKAITDSAQAIKAFYAEDWKIFCLHVRFVQKSRTGMMSPLQGVAKLTGVSPNTVCRKRREVPRMIARDAMGHYQMALDW